jgi:hypothetical protein
MKARRLGRLYGAAGRKVAGHSPLTGVRDHSIMTHMTKTQVYLRSEELDALHHVAERTGKSVAELVREAVRQVWLRPAPEAGPVALWDGAPRRSAVEHDTIYDDL